MNDMKLDTNNFGLKLKTFCGVFLTILSIFFISRQVTTTTYTMVTDEEIMLRISNTSIKESFAKIDSPKVAKNSDENKNKICSASQRRDALEAACTASNQTDRKSLLHAFQQCQDVTCKSNIKRVLSYPFVVDNQRKLLICLVPKTGVTSYTSVLISYTDKFRQQHPNQTAMDVYGYRIYYAMEPYNLTTPNTLSDEEFETVLKTYTKILTTRHPYARLISFYKDKVAGSDCKKLIGFPDKIIEHARGIKVENRRDACNMSITFDEFFNYYKTYRRHDWNSHLKRVSEICKPCEIDYDFYMRTETSTHDQEYLIREYLQSPNRPSTISTFNANSLGNLTKPTVIFKEFSNRTKDDIDWMNMFYADDLNLFGYKSISLKEKLIGKCAIENSTCC